MAPFGVTFPLLLSLNAGFADTAGFLALQGLFTAHVTGNFVTLGASQVLEMSTNIAVFAAGCARRPFCTHVSASGALSCRRY